MIGDLSDPRVVDEVVETAVETFGGVDVLVNNAGIMDHMSAVADTDDDEWDRVIRVNLTAPFLLTRAALPHMLSAGGGSIVFTASEAALRGSTARAAYTASKHGIVGLTKSLAVLYRSQGIRTNAVAPGPTATNIRIETRAKAHGPRLIGPCIGLSGKVSEPRSRPPPSPSSPPTPRATPTAPCCPWTTAGPPSDERRADAEVRVRRCASGVRDRRS